MVIGIHKSKKYKSTQIKIYHRSWYESYHYSNDIKILISSDLVLTSPPSTEGSRAIVARQYFVSNSRG